MKLNLKNNNNNLFDYLASKYIQKMSNEAVQVFSDIVRMHSDHHKSYPLIALLDSGYITKDYRQYDNYKLDSSFDLLTSVMVFRRFGFIETTIKMIQSGFTIDTRNNRGSFIDFWCAQQGANNRYTVDISAVLYAYLDRYPDAKPEKNVSDQIFTEIYRIYLADRASRLCDPISQNQSIKSRPL